LIKKAEGYGQVWWCTPTALALGRLRQEDLEFKGSMGYIVRPCLKTKRKKERKIGKKGKKN
jgi:hypothetical protein